jgi:soluble cytochrome b562
MKRFPIVAAGLALAMAAPAAAQSPDSAPKPMMNPMEDHAMSGWKELDAFHMVLMQTWHPAKGMNNLSPIRAKAEELAQKAERWAKSVFPEKCDTPALREAVTKVSAQSQALAKLVTEGSDEQVKAALKEVHDRFEIVEQGCTPGKAHH